MAKVLDGEVKKDIWELLLKTNETIKSQDYKETLQLCLKVWDLLPDEKYEYAESWLALNGILNNAIEIGDFELVKAWIDKIDYVVPGGYDAGEREFMKGKVAYELGDYDAAREYLSYANKKSRGRCFGDKDKKYVNFLVEKK